MKLGSKKLLIFASALFMLAFIFVGCSSANDEGDILLTDLSGRTIKLDKPATRIAALSASDCEVLCAAGAEDTIIARGTYCDYPEEIKNIKDVGSGELTNLEELVAIKPDVVLMSKTGFTLDQVNAMEAAGLKTFVNEPNTFEDTYTYISLLAKMTGHDAEGQKLVSEMQNRVSDLRDKCKNNEQKSVYFQLSLPEHGY